MVKIAYLFPFLIFASSFGMQPAKLSTKYAQIPSKVISTQGMSFDKQGNLTPDSAKQLLERAFKMGIIPFEEFKNAACLKVKTLAEEKAQAPWKTVQLFSVESSCGGKGSFILKEMKEPEQEIKRLMKITHSKPLEPLIFPNESPRYPQFILPIAYLSYEFNGKKRQLSLMPFASGKSLMSLFERFEKNPTDKKLLRTIAQAYFDTGAALARYDKKYMVGVSKMGLPISIAQGDLHAGNIFYNNETRHVSIIDNETMAASIDKPENVCEDIAFLLMKSLFVVKWVSGQTLQKFSYDDWYDIYLPNFIAGFLSTYPKKEVKTIFDAIHHCLANYKDPKTGINWYTDTQTLKTITHKEFMEPRFERLRRWVDIPFIASDSDVNEKDDRGKTKLFTAAVSERLWMWPLIAAGVDVNARDNDNNTALHDAAYADKANAIKVLVDAGADINAQDKNGDTPLHKAVYSKSNEAIKMLLKLGANKNIKNKDGKVAL